MDKAAALVAKVVGTGKTVATNAIAGVKKLMNGVFGKKSFVAGKEQHSIWVKVTNNQPELWIASTPREATAQINALENEAKAKNLLPLVIDSIQLARGKVTSARDVLKKKVAAGVVDDTAMSRHATGAVSGVEFSVKDVFDQIAKGTVSSNLKLNLNFAQLKHEFWSGGRPAFSAATKKALGTISDTEDRRHVQASDDIFKNAVAAINGKTFADAGTWLTGKGFKPAKSELQEIKKQLKAYLGKEFSRLENLWVGEKRENQQKGSELGAAERELKSLTPRTPAYEAALARRSAAVVDPAKGTAAGKKIGAIEQNRIDEIRLLDTRLPRYQNSHLNSNLIPNTPVFREASLDRANTISNQQALGDFSKKMNAFEFNAINLILRLAAKIIYELNGLLKT